MVKCVSGFDPLPQYELQAIFAHALQQSGCGPLKMICRVILLKRIMQAFRWSPYGQICYPVDRPFFLHAATTVARRAARVSLSHSGFDPGTASNC